jgi:hypothetical protein
MNETNPRRQMKTRTIPGIQDHGTRGIENRETEKETIPKNIQIMIIEKPNSQRETEMNDE